MHYIIDNLIKFIPEKRLLININTGAQVKLYVPASNMFLNLICNPSKDFTYGELISLAWKRDNNSVSISTVHQNILNIRRALRQLGLENNIIISIPKEGFRLCNTVVLRDNKKTTPHTFKKNKEVYSVCFCLFISALLLIVVKSTQYSLFAFEQHYIDTGKTAGDCKVYVNSDAPALNISEAVIKNIHIDCNKKTDAYVTYYQKDNYSIFLCKNRLPFGLSKVCINKIHNS